MNTQHNSHSISLFYLKYMLWCPESWSWHWCKTCRDFSTFKKSQIIWKRLKWQNSQERSKNEKSARKPANSGWKSNQKPTNLKSGKTQIVGLHQCFYFCMYLWFCLFFNVFKQQLFLISNQRLGVFQLCWLCVRFLQMSVLRICFLIFARLRTVGNLKFQKSFQISILKSKRGTLAHTGKMTGELPLLCWAQWFTKSLLHSILWGLHYDGVLRARHLWWPYRAWSCVLILQVSGVFRFCSMVFRPRLWLHTQCQTEIVVP